MIICKEQPVYWGGKYVLRCKHSFNSKSRIHYLMYCNHLGYTKSGKVKLLVFGYRHIHTRGGRVRYTRTKGWRNQKRISSASNKKAFCLKPITNPVFMPWL